MRLLSCAKTTLFYKKIFPFLLCATVAALAGFKIYATLAKTPDKSATALSIFICLVLFSMFMAARYMMSKYLDEVWDNGDDLVLVKDDVKHTVPLFEIVKISDDVQTKTRELRPTLITFVLRQPHQLGNEVSFLPDGCWKDYRSAGMHPITQELMNRKEGIKMNKENDPVSGENQKQANSATVASYVRAMGGVEMLAGIALGFNLGGISDALFGQSDSLIRVVLGGGLFIAGMTSYFLMPKLLTRKPPSST